MNSQRRPEPVFPGRPERPVLPRKKHKARKPWVVEVRYNHELWGRKSRKNREWHAMSRYASERNAVEALATLRKNHENFRRGLSGFRSYPATMEPWYEYRLVDPDGQVVA